MRRSRRLRRKSAERQRRSASAKRKKSANAKRRKSASAKRKRQRKIIIVRRAIKVTAPRKTMTVRRRMILLRR